MAYSKCRRKPKVQTKTERKRKNAEREMDTCSGFSCQAEIPPEVSELFETLRGEALRRAWATGQCVHTLRTRTRGFLSFIWGPAQGTVEKAHFFGTIQFEEAGGREAYRSTMTGLTNDEECYFS